MSEYKLTVGSKVVFCSDDKNRDINENEDGYPEVVGHYGVGEIVEVRGEGSHRFKVRWLKRGSAYWMRNRDLLTPEESEEPSLPCWSCMKYTRRLHCPVCFHSSCARHLKKGKCGYCGGKNK